ncbi:hypothetical protein GCM10025867_27010 [Frondihabitans sucicola]|uniref:DUF3043 domain-containing protein n=1 Tax=Frondihabitans sucicola TaxID=1268041 RepID=A0ABM8GPT7_9MICO|nr:DUF3043 domain-containing protein [Frondihabitans sucicola]BDZ50460.1 hypothetical protein GCM10025867_27010 [Frondihabitans sucicola]
MAKAPIISPDNSTEGSAAPQSGKGRPTPTRKEREAANLRPLVAKGKEAQKAQRDRVAEQRNRARVGLANGEEKFLPSRDKGPQRKFVRDYVDARYSVGEAMIPIMVIVIILSIIPNASSITLVILWVYFLVAIIDCLLVGQRIRGKLGAKYGADKVESGLRWYAAMRALQLKPMRLPKPQVKRGQFPA